MRISTRQRASRSGTAATCPTTLAAALAMTTADKLVYGSDCGLPCTTQASMQANIEALLAFSA